MERAAATSSTSREQRSTEALNERLAVTRSAADRWHKKCRDLEARVEGYKSAEVQRSRERDNQRSLADKDAKETRRLAEREIRRLVSLPGYY